MIVWMLSGGMGVLFLVALWLGWRWRRADGLLDKAILKQKKESEELQALRQEVEQTRPLLQTHMGMNEQFEKERNEAWALYRRSSTESMNGHRMLLQELERVVLMVNTYRKKEGEPEVQINPGIAGFMQAFKESHA